MQGNLSEQAAADVLSKVQGLQASGVLRVENGKTIRQLFIDAGSIIRFAASNLPAEGLTSLLKQKAGVTDDQLRQATASKKQNELLGTALVRLGALPGERLAELTQEHVGQVLRAILSLREGRFRFQVGDLPFRDQVDGGHSIAELLLRWGRDFEDIMRIRYKLGSPESFVRRVQTPPAGTRNLPLEAAEGYALSRLDVPTSLRDLCTLSPVPEEATLRAVHALRLAGMIRIVPADERSRPAPQIVGTRPAAQQSASPSQDPIPAPDEPPAAEASAPPDRQAAATMPGAPSAAAPAPGSSGTNPEPVAAAPEPAAAPLDQTAPGEEAARDTGTASADEAAPPAPPVSSVDVSPDRVPGNGGAPHPEPAQVERVRPLNDLERDMLVRFDQLHDQTMYGVLGVEQQVSTIDIRRAYYALARTLHPDKFRQDDMKAKAEKVFARITEAYSTLANENQRGKYDEELSRRSGKGRNEEQVDPAIMARLNFNRGKEHYEKGKYPQALSFFENACEQDATKGAYYLYLGMTQSHNPRLRKKAAQNLHKSLELDPTSAQPYVELGHLYVRMGQKKRGHEMYRNALQWDASNEEAQRGLGGDQKEEKRGFLGMFGKKKSAAS